MARANTYDTALNQAKIRQAEANLSSIEKQIEDSMIKSPISGTVTKVEYEPGEKIAANMTVVSVLGENNFEIEALISESDIAKIKKGNLAEITLDAFGDDTKFAGKVLFIEPAETIIQEVIYYKLIVEFETNDRDVKSGMTANVAITTAQKKDVLVIPGRALIDKNSHGKFVRVLENNQVEEKKVIVGLKGDGGLVEIVDGLNSGDEVVLSINEK